MSKAQVSVYFPEVVRHFDTDTEEANRVKQVYEEYLNAVYSIYCKPMLSIKISLDRAKHANVSEVVVLVNMSKIEQLDVVHISDITIPTIEVPSKLIT